jgi:hypothetical protein
MLRSVSLHKSRQASVPMRRHRQKRAGAAANELKKISPADTVDPADFCNNIGQMPTLIA